MEIIIAIILVSLVCVIGFILYRRKIDKELIRIDVVEKDVEADARFFISAVFRSGRSELITPKALTEEELYEVSANYTANYNKKGSK